MAVRELARARANWHGVGYWSSRRRSHWAWKSLAIVASSGKTRAIRLWSWLASRVDWRVWASRRLAISRRGINSVGTSGVALGSSRKAKRPAQWLSVGSDLHLGKIAWRYF